MDSGNSASLQSSSGGDDNQEYDSSRAVADHNSSFSSLQNNTSMFDPFANYFNPTNIISRPQQLQNYPSASLVNLDMSTDWSKTLRSDQSFGQSPGMSFPPAAAEHGSSNNVIVTTTAPAAAPVVAQSTVPTQDQQQPVRNPKKRSRASRRAPTTVLTTDTSNFRAMVQEFTGIPSPPFTAASSYFPRSRLDIFPTSSLRSGPSTNHLPLNISQPPNYLRRPFPQKIQPPTLGPTSFLSPPNSSSSSLLSCLANNTTTSATSNSTNNYQLMMSSELGGLLKPQQLSSGVTNSVTQSSNIFTSNIQNNSILTSLLHERYPLGSKEQSFEIPSSNNSQRSISHLGANILEQYGMSSTQHGLPNLISPEQAAASRNESNIQNGDNKVQETMGSRGEGMVESWICSSDH